MTKVITYGTFDLLHYGHIRLLERAKALGDYLIVGVTADDFDKTRGKINVQQSLMERIEGVRATGLADEIIVEEYEGQKIDDIKHYGVDFFTVGSDWVGTFDYLNEYCKVVYLERTQGISSTELRSQNQPLRLGLVGDGAVVLKYFNEAMYVNGIQVVAACSADTNLQKNYEQNSIIECKDFDTMLSLCDAVYIGSVPERHESQIRKAIEHGKHVLVESPITTDPEITAALFALAEEKKVVLMEAIKTAYATAYDRLLLLVKTGKIGQVVSIDSVCTSLTEAEPQWEQRESMWSGFEAWGPTALLPVYQILGVDNCKETFVSSFYTHHHFDKFTQINVVYPHAVATARVGVGAKAEGQLIISGTKGYIYVPAPWWKTDYFEIRYENQMENKRYFYQLEGEGIRYEIVAFARAISSGKNSSNIEKKVSLKISEVFQKFCARTDLIEIELI